MLNHSSQSWIRLRGLLKKETRQIFRDPSSLLLALVMPVVLLIIFGYGVSLTITNIPLAWVDHANTSISRDLKARFEGSPSYALKTASLSEAQALVKAKEVDGILYLQSNFGKRFLTNESTPVQLLLDGVDSNRANLIRGYVLSTLAQWDAIRSEEGQQGRPVGASVESRTWFNENSESRNFLIPGLVALILTVIGTLTTALVIAREWERGTMEAILATPLRMHEFLLGKSLPYFALGMFGFLVSLLGAIVLFGVPLRGSLWLLTLSSALYLFVAVGLGLALSARIKVQFVAAQASIIIGFLPAFFLSGFLFDLGSTPPAVQWLSYLIPARHFAEILKTLFLVGNVWSVLGPGLIILAIIAVILFALTWKSLSLRIEP